LRGFFFGKGLAIWSEGYKNRKARGEGPSQCEKNRFHIVISHGCPMKTPQFASLKKSLVRPAKMAIALAIVLLIGPANEAWVRALHCCAEFSTGIVAGLLISALLLESPISPAASRKEHSK
jgi:hypothetical protein